METEDAGLNKGQIYGVDKFGGDGFYDWKFQMQMALEARGLWDVVSNQTDLETMDDVKRALHKSLDRKAYAAIVLCLKKDQYGNVRSCTSAAEAWKNLVAQYEVKNLNNKLYLRKKFFTVKMSEGEGMAAHINKVVGLADQLSGIGAPVSSEDIVMTILASLPESYEYLITTLESRADELTIPFIKARLLQEEAKRVESGKATHEAAMAVQQRPATRTMNRNCFYCDKPGHRKKDCFKRIADEKKKSEDAGVSTLR